ncbi:MAG TPA: hypothetical protein VEL05_00745 [Candidatus Acidoferrum sp.]|nr:hypothetical protein [Candidatus Acidoferrum sp.]
MSRYGYIACHDCKIDIWLGKALFANGRPVAFHVGQETDPPNSRNELLTRALWKFLAEHAGHHVSILVEGTPGFEALADYGEIGGDVEGDVSLADYVRDFSG